VPNIDEVYAALREVLSARRVFGEPVEQGGVIVIPAASVRGGGGGGGDAQGDGGGGFGVQATPIGAWVIRGGEVTWRPAVDVNRLVLFGALLALVVLLRRRR
jgi:uncharacterized spore protein YtfJ